MRVLLAEVDPMIGESVLDLLRGEHQSVDSVRDGERAATALRGRSYQLAQRIEGPDADADDDLLEPFEGDALLVRGRALLRRAAGRAEPVCRHMGLSIDPATRAVSVDGSAVGFQSDSTLHRHHAGGSVPHPYSGPGAQRARPRLRSPLTFARSRWHCLNCLHCLH